MRIVSTQNTEYLLDDEGTCMAVRRRGFPTFGTAHRAVGRVAIPYGVDTLDHPPVRGGRLYLMGREDVLLTTEITALELVGDEVLALVEEESGVRTATGPSATRRGEGHG